jgi:uncharacterized protein YneF (UPF0154 family)
MLAAAFVVMLIAVLIGILIIYFVDRNQTEHAVRRNYPVIGRFRYLFEYLGEFFR